LLFMTYELALDPDGTAWVCRENLTAILERELLGPMYGDREVISSPPGDAYSIGRIAPRRLTDTGDPESEADGSLGDADSAKLSTGVPAEDSDESPVDADEDANEDVGPRRGLMIPASMGLRFQIPTDLDTVTVTARWGTYRSRPVERAETEDPDGRSSRQRSEYVRTPWEVIQRLQVRDLVDNPHQSVKLSGTITLEVDTYVAGDRILVELALCNNRETPSRIPTEAWMFQTQIQVHADGACVFLPVRDILTEPDDEHDDELRRLSLQYRHRLEFAIGRTCSADWDDPDPVTRRTTGVRTTWIPISETPRTEARPDDRVLTDMLALADADPATLADGLLPIAAGYGAWLDEQAIHAATLPGHLRAVAGESASGQIVGIEIKAASTVYPRDARHLAWLRDHVGTTFQRGIILHTGATTYPLGERIWAVPIAALWQ
jgi:hypothetical protein